MYNALFGNITDAEKNSAVENIIQHATPRKDFFLMLALSVSMAAFGILLGSNIILIGSMLIAPLLYPLISLSLGIIMSDSNLVGRSVITFVKSVIYALIAGFVIGLLFSGSSTVSLPFTQTTTGGASLMYAVVAAIAGFAAAFAVTKPHLNETLPGVAISVALVPPLAEAGIALSSLEMTAFSNSILLLLVNVIGVVFSAMIVFALLRFSTKKTVAEKVVKEEDKTVAQEESKTE